MMCCLATRDKDQSPCQASVCVLPTNLGEDRRRDSFLGACAVVCGLQDAKEDFYLSLRILGSGYSLLFDCL